MLVGHTTFLHFRVAALVRTNRQFACLSICRASMARRLCTSSMVPSIRGFFTRTFTHSISRNMAPTSHDVHAYSLGRGWVPRYQDNLVSEAPATGKRSVEHHDVITYSAEITTGHSVSALDEENTLQCAWRKLRSTHLPQPYHKILPKKLGAYLDSYWPSAWPGVPSLSRQSVKATLVYEVES